jgi:acyl-CoA thioesterase I
MKFLGLFILLICIVPSLVFSQNRLKVACVGNSITQGPGREDPGSYPLQMQKILGENFEVKNFGVSGRTLLKKGDYPFWNEPQFQEVLAFSPDILVIKLGTNDSKPQNWQHKADFKQDYMDLIAAIKSNMPKKGKVFICIPVPVFQDNYDINGDVMANEIRPLLLEIAKATKSQVIDLNAPLSDKPELLPDGIHPNEAGLAIIAAEVARQIQNSK